MLFIVNLDLLSHLISPEMLALSEAGDNSAVDMLVKDIYGQDYSKLGLKSTMIASSFGKVFKKGKEKRKFSPEDISKSLLYAVSNNIGQIAFVPFKAQDVIACWLLAGTWTRKNMASIGYILAVASFGATLRLLPRYRTPFGSGAKAQSVRYFFGTRDSCTCQTLAVFLINAHRLLSHSGAIGAWIKNIDGDRESETGDTWEDDIGKAWHTHREYMDVLKDLTSLIITILLLML
jgi:hypothetical protein